jgi:hypothetical protein
MNGHDFMADFDVPCIVSIDTISECLLEREMLDLFGIRNLAGLGGFYAHIHLATFVHSQQHA